MALIEIENLSVNFSSPDGQVQAVRDVSLALEEGQSLGIVGESGSGKSVSLMALLRLLPEQSATIKANKLMLDGVNMLACPHQELAKVRGKVASLVFQDPMASFDPLFKIGDQLTETVLTHFEVTSSEALVRVEKMLDRVEMPDSKRVINSYPHQLSGGMLQRAMIAMALVCEPKVLIADEPTTALDVTVQAQILQLIGDLQQETGMGLIMITHDLGVVAETVDNIVVMYGGKVMEQTSVFDLFDRPRHPYSKALLESIPGQLPGKRKLKEIPGQSPNPLSPPAGCPFHFRCENADQNCIDQMPPLTRWDQTNATACLKVAS
ncbi:ABC transporter ATP-binding protein [uncultured Maritalea sp.]|jgi:oligopeptide/dipeptide ABC transporter ATP-binding protein|uniref:ABC transporter ATP-binding protein n=1 Tax=uncultured Maritalea sp. TaxID=757249 RepID=UPI002620DA42|nr:ABC transporter ATP-binding protein [uncultured Maritalea sp.]